jgi:hypothetical protein
MRQGFTADLFDAVKNARIDGLSDQDIAMGLAWITPPKAALLVMVKRYPNLEPTLRPIIETINENF